MKLKKILKETIICGIEDENNNKMDKNRIEKIHNAEGIQYETNV